MNLTTKTAQRLKICVEANDEVSIAIIINFKNELKEIIKLPLIKEHIEILIEEIESVENAKTM